jgi:hypothetical protein
VRNLDLVIRIIFNRSEDHGELRIDRLGQFFEICMVVDGETIMPISGDWDLILEYLQASVKSRSIGT